MKKKSIIIVVVVLLLCAVLAAVHYLLGTRKGTVTANPPVPYVSEIISDSSRPENVLVRNFNPDKASSAVFVIGSKERCSQFADVLTGQDVFDNVDGIPEPDGLKDFAGETICTIADYTGALSAASIDGEALREFTVRSVLAAMDTLCFVSPYDRSGMGKKPLAKLVVLASPCMTEYGRYDVDSLFNALGCSLNVLSPVKMIAERIVEKAEKGSVLSVGVLSSDTPESVYASLLGKATARAGIDSVVCVSFKTVPESDPLTGLLDHYSSLGHDRPLDALIVDDLQVNMEAVAASLSVITSVMNEESLTYGKLLSPSCVIADTGSLTGREVYGSFRSRNVFTHYISQPRRSDFMLLRREGEEKSLRLLQYNERYIPEIN